MNQEILELEDIQAAGDRIRGRVHRTPLHTSAQLGHRYGVELRLKAELFQKTGSFKARGLLHRVLTLSTEERDRGLISISAGNAAAALAWAAASLRTTALIVMPARAVRSKIDATRAYGGEVVLTEHNLLDTCRELQRQRGLTFVHPFDDLAVMAGHGTLGLEILEDEPDSSCVIVPVGGGGLIGGVAAALKLSRPEVRVIGVEPVGAAAMTRSLEQGSPATLDQLDTVADGLAAPFAGRHTLAHVRQFVDRVVTVDDEAIVEALRLILTRAKLAAEPSGAAALAPLVAGAIELEPGSKVVCVVSGGNIDRGLLARLLKGDA